MLYVQELATGMQAQKCLKCGCMKDALIDLEAAIPSLEVPNKDELLSKIAHWLQQLQPVSYSCLGCKHCYPAVATNAFYEAYPNLKTSRSLACQFEINQVGWPVVPGDYYHFCDGGACTVAVSTLGSVDLVQKLADIHPPELCIVGKTETENIGIDKIIKNTITNSTIRYLILSGKDSEGHYPGQTMLALWENGVDDRMRVIGSIGKRPILSNVDRVEVERFREQVQVVDLIDCEDVEMIVEKLEEIGKAPVPTGCSCSDCGCHTTQSVPAIDAKAPEKIKLDKAGYFVIIPQLSENTIVVEHYAYDNSLLRVIKGNNAREIYWTIIENNWVSELSHAAYLGKELMRAELSLTGDYQFVQDGA